MIKDYSRLVADSAAMDCRITRVDLAYDDLEGKHGVLDAKQDWQSGLFNVKGRFPESKHIENSHNRGDTFYVGRRESIKMYRVYEKGKQLGDHESLWVRHEAEFKHDRNRVLPWDMLIHRSQYLKGAYPDALAWMRGGATYLKIAKQKTTVILGRLLEHGKHQVGSLINYCRDHLAYSADQIIEVLSGKPGRYPPSLIEAIKLGVVP